MDKEIKDVLKPLIEGFIDMSETEAKTLDLLAMSLPNLGEAERRELHKIARRRQLAAMAWKESDLFLGIAEWGALTNASRDRQRTAFILLNLLGDGEFAYKSGEDRKTVRRNWGELRPHIRSR
jgi:hypothetical protein